MTDHDKLREAIGSLRNARIVLSGNEVCFLDPGVANLVANVVESKLPRTKMVEVWHIIYCERVDTTDRHQWEPRIGLAQSEYFAEVVAAAYRELSHKYRYISVTGPHQQEVAI